MIRGPSSAVARGPPGRRHRRRTRCPCSRQLRWCARSCRARRDELREKCGDPTGKPRPETEAGEEGGEEAGGGRGSRRGKNPSGRRPRGSRARRGEGGGGGARVVRRPGRRHQAGASRVHVGRRRGEEGGVRHGRRRPRRPRDVRVALHLVPAAAAAPAQGGLGRATRFGRENRRGGRRRETDAEKTADEPVVEPVEEPPYPEESEEEAESRRDAHPDRAPNLHLRLVFDDGGVYAKKVKRVDSEGYAAYVTWAEAEDAARDAHEGGDWRRARRRSARGRRRLLKETPRARASPHPMRRRSRRRSRKSLLSSRWRRTRCPSGCSARRACGAWTSRRPSRTTRLSKAKRALGDRSRMLDGAPQTLVEDDDLRATVELFKTAVAAAGERTRRAPARRARGETRAAARARARGARGGDAAPAQRELAAVPPRRGDAGGDGGDGDAGARSAEDPAEALAEFLIRTDKKREAEEEAERVAAEAMERAVAEELRLREKERKLAASRRAAAEAQAAIRPRSVVRKVPVIPNAREARRRRRVEGILREEPTDGGGRVKRAREVTSLEIVRLLLS